MGLSIFEWIDILFLAVLLISLIIFLHKNKRNLSKEGSLYLYKTSWGIKLINYIGGRYKKTLGFLSYASIAFGYINLVGISYLLGNTLFQYLTNPLIVETIRAPPITPVIPYFPQLFGLSEFFPPLYGIYFIFAILIVATIHEFSHGIFARRWGVRIKSTGFAFLSFFPALFGAFVEQDDTHMAKKSKFKQLSILSAGVFANIVTAIIFFVLLVLFFHLAFSPSGVVFDAYPSELVGISAITSLNGISLDNASYGKLVNLSDEDGFNKIEANGRKYVITKKTLQLQENNVGKIILYNDAPAVKAKLERAIFKINGVGISSVEELQNELLKYNPEEKIILNVLGSDGGDYDREIVLGKNPKNESSPWLGIGFSERGGVIKNEFLHFMDSFRPANLNFMNHTYYSPLLGKASGFIYYLIWWVVLINFLIALFNMLPVGILDGGRFFYITVLGITKSEKAASKIYGIAGYIILATFILLMLKWALSFF